MAEPKIERIRITNLHLDLKNPRFEEQPSQMDAIHTMIADQQEKLMALAKDIFENGLNPTDLIVVERMTDGNNQYRVLEGNRRITCLKLISNPKLVPETFPNIRRLFVKLNGTKERADQLRRPLCVIFDQEEDADVWIERKHSGEQDGRGTIAWNPLQKSRYKTRHGAKGSLPLQVVNFLGRLSKEDTSLKSLLYNLENTTNIERLLSDPYVREVLMLNLQDGFLKSFDTIERTKKKLVKLLEATSQSDFNVNVIKHKSDRKTFIDDFHCHLDDPNPTALEQGWSLNDPGCAVQAVQQPSNGGAAGQPAPMRLPKPTRKLIADDFQIPIDDTRIGQLFKELKGMLPSTHPNAVAVLLRVFVELSVDCFNERYCLLPDGCLTSSSSHEPLKDKIDKSIRKLKKLGKINDDLAKGILHELKDDNSALSIHTMNGFVHNYHFSPKADSLRTGWENIKWYIERLWQNMPPKA